MKRKISAQQKLQILEEARQPNTTIAEVCRRHQISAAQFYGWEKAARQGALEALMPKKPGADRSQQREERLREKIQRLQATISEITAENLDLKKLLASRGEDSLHRRGEAATAGDGPHDAAAKPVERAPHSGVLGPGRLGVLRVAEAGT